MNKSRYLIIFFIMFLTVYSIANNLIAQKKPVVYIYVSKECADQSESVRLSGQSEWYQIPAFYHLFVGDSLNIPKNASVIWGDATSEWKQFHGPQLLMAQGAIDRKSNFGTFIDRLALIFEKRRSYTRDAVKNATNLFISMPDTVLAFQFPKQFYWASNEPWWAEYKIHVTRNTQTLLDTTVTGDSIGLGNIAMELTAPGVYRLQITALNSNPCKSFTASSVINILQTDYFYPRNKTILQNLEEQKQTAHNSINYYPLINYCLTEELYSDLENILIQTICRYPDTREYQMVLYAYYASFMPAEFADYLTRRHRLTE